MNGLHSVYSTAAKFEFQINTGLRRGWPSPAKSRQMSGTYSTLASATTSPTATHSPTRLTLIQRSVLNKISALHFDCLPLRASAFAHGSYLKKERETIRKYLEVTALRFADVTNTFGTRDSLSPLDANFLGILTPLLANVRVSLTGP